MRWLSTSLFDPGLAGDAPGFLGKAVAGEQMLPQPRAIAGPGDQPLDAFLQHGLMDEDVGTLGEIGERRKEGRVG